jgi:hypothetical protein
MKNVKQILAMAGVVAALSAGTALAQNNGNNNTGGGGGGGFGGGGRGNWRNMSPEERAQARMDGYREDLEVKDDAEWKALQPLVQKVLDAQRQVLADRMSGMFGRFRRGGPGGDNGGDQGGRQRGGGPGGFFGGGTPSAESETLKRAVDGKASNSEMKAAIAKFLEARKTNEANLQKAQDDLRKVLSVRQEGIATLNGLL